SHLHEISHYIVGKWYEGDGLLSNLKINHKWPTIFVLDNYIPTLGPNWPNLSLTYYFPAESKYGLTILRRLVNAPMYGFWVYLFLLSTSIYLIGIHWYSYPLIVLILCSPYTLRSGNDV